MRISVCVPIYNMDNAQYFLERNLLSIVAQNFKDYEIVVSDDSEDDMLKTWIMNFSNKYPQIDIAYVKNLDDHGMAENSNNAINYAQGELIKILYQDDYFAHANALGDIVDHFTERTMWLVTGCTHTMDGIHTFNDHKPWYSESENSIGSPSVLTFRREIKERFDPSFHWVLDLDLYKRLYRQYGKPKVYDQINVIMGIHSGQKTSLLSDERKRLEHEMLKLKYENTFLKIKENP